MKKWIDWLVAALLCLALVPFGLAAELNLSSYTDEELISLRNQINEELKLREAARKVSSPESDFVYVSNGEAVQINQYIGKGGNVVIPNEIEGLPVTRIAAEAFRNTKKITGIVFPDKLEFIGNYAFYDATRLTGIIVLPATVKKVDSHAFQSSNISGVVIQSSCEIGVNAFSNVSNLEFFYVAEGCAPDFAHSSLTYAKKLKTVIFPDTVVDIHMKNLTNSNQATIYTPAGSFAENFAKQNFIRCNTQEYAEMAAYYASLY